MKQSLQLRIGQQLSMTPQLQQAIRLLQLSTLDLKQEIQQMIDSNFMLEREESETGLESLQSLERRTEKLEHQSSADEAVNMQTDKLPDELPTDSQWEDSFDMQSSGLSVKTSNANELDFDSLSNIKSNDSLLAHLRWQLNLSILSDIDQMIAEVIIDSIDEAGYLTLSLSEIEATLNNHEIQINEIEAVRHRIQQFEPLGVASVDLKDCLLVQLKALPENTPYLAEAKKLISRYFKLLVQGNEIMLQKRLRVSAEQLKEIHHLIKTLTPNPGYLYGDVTVDYIEPDVYVFQREGKWVVELNPDASPKLAINQTYASLVKRADNSKDNQCLKDHLTDARWFIKSLQGRNETLVSVATKIVEVQRAYFEYGDEAMKPLVLKEIAEDLGLHESTISRVTNQKYMHTPQGVIEFKHFFSSHVSTALGGECSATAIKALIKKLIAAEKPQKPLSDDKLSSILKEQGIKVARRTVAKYREGMAILSSSKRKRLN